MSLGGKASRRSLGLAATYAEDALHLLLSPAGAEGSGSNDVPVDREIDDLGCS